MTDLKELKELRDMEGLSKRTTESLEQTIKNITRGEEPCYTLAQEVGYE